MPLDLGNISVGKVGFIEEHGLWTDMQKAAAERVRAQVREQQLETVRICWGDQHGLARGKHLTARDFMLALENGQDFQSATLIMDTTNNIIVPLFVQGGGFGIPEMTGYPDVLLVPDPTTFAILPYAPRTGWVLSDMYFSNGKPVPFSTRQLLRDALAALTEHGYGYVAGLEVEWYLTKLEDAKLTPEQSGWPPEPPGVSTSRTGSSTSPTTARTRSTRSCSCSSSTCVHSACRCAAWRTNGAPASASSPSTRSKGSGRQTQ